MIMRRLVKTEFFKLYKADHILLVALLFLYPIMWSILAYRNEIVLIENGHSMLSWVLIQLFSMEKSFVSTLVFILLINTIVGDEQKKLYFSMIQSRGVSIGKMYLAKFVAVMGYLILVSILVIIGISLCYAFFVRNNRVMASGKAWNVGELVPGMKILLIWILDKCILLPSVFIWLSKKRSIFKSVIIIILLSFLDRVLNMFSNLSFLSIWNSYEKAEHFVSLCEKGHLEIHMNIFIQIILYAGIAVWLLKSERKMNTI